MKSIIKKSIYAGLGILSDGASVAQALGKELAKRTDVSEAEGERVARKLSVESRRAVRTLQKSVDSEVSKIADKLHATLRPSRKTKKHKSTTATKARAKRKAT
jgi:polyhydroxyalkanoate synthesis regulator phasin